MLALPHPFRDPIESMPTAVIRLSPDFLAQLRNLANKKKRSKTWVWVFALVVLAGAIAGAIPSSRAVIAKQVVAHFQRQPAAVSQAAVAPVTETAPAAPSMLPSSSLVSMRAAVLSLSSSIEAAKNVLPTTKTSKRR